MADFNVGDVVQLKSGGPPMTVEQVGTDDSGAVRVWCSWFDKNEKKTSSFFAAAVERL